MLTLEREHYSRILTTWAEELSKESILPVDIVKIVNRFNLRIVRHKDIKEGSSKLAFVNGSPEIRLSRVSGNKSDILTHFERFLLAHELGHYILSRECNIAPNGDAEYWQHEDICNMFSLLLLLPQKLIEGELQEIKLSHQIFPLIKELAYRAKVPESRVSSRICLYNSHIAVFFVERPDKKSFKISWSALPHKKEIGRKIHCESQLGQILSTLRRDDSQAILPSEVFSNGPIPSCIDVKEGVATLKSPFIIVITVISDHSLANG